MNGSSRTQATGGSGSHHHNHHRGGARGGGVTRAGPTVYRPVHADAESAPSGRKVVVLDADDSEPHVFTSSLQVAIREERPAPAPTATGGHTKHDKQQTRVVTRSEKPKSQRSAPPRERSASPQKRGDARRSAGEASSRVVTSLSAAPVAATAVSPKKQDDRKKPAARQPVMQEPSKADSPPRYFVSSLTGQTVSKENAGVRLSDDKHGRGGGGGGGGGRNGGGRDPRAQTNHRVVENASQGAHQKLSEKNLAAHASAMHGGRPRRKNSAESLSSMRSGYSARSEWSELSDYSRASSKRGDRDSRYSGSHRYDDNRHSMGNGSRGGRYGGAMGDAGPAGRLSRSASESNRSHVETLSAPAQQHQQQHVAPSARSSQDVRFQKSASSVSSHQDHHGREQGAAAADPNGSTTATAVGGARISLREGIQIRNGGLDSRAPEISRSRSSSLARSVMSDVDSTPRNSFHKNSEPASRAAPSKPVFTSALSRSVNEAEKKEAVTGASQKPAEPAVDEAERRRLVGATLLEKMEARNAERASTSTASEMKKEFHSGNLLAGTATPETSTLTSKLQRSNDHFERIQKEDAQREAVRRSTNTFTSSLAMSFNTGLSAPSSRTKKICFTVVELRRLKPPTVVKPRDLPDMTIMEVIEFRPQTGYPTPSGPLRSGRIMSHERERVVGRLARKPERGGRAQVTVQRQSSYGGGRAEAGRQRRGGGGGGGNGGGGRGGRNNAPPPPPLYDGPIEPLTKSENRWVAKKTSDLSTVESVLSQVKSLLNKLTREKFAKITQDICAIELTNFELLRSVVTVIMDKALEEPNFADVYADLCKEINLRTANKRWSFIRVVESVAPPAAFFWTAVREEDYQSMLGPFKSMSECFEDALLYQSASSPTSDRVPLAPMKFFHQNEDVIAVAELSPGSFFYLKRSMSELSEDEPMVGSFPSAEAAITAAHQQASFKGLLVTRCQFEFERTNKRSSSGKEKAQEAAANADMDPRQKEILAMRAKRRMLGNIRFIGELFKVDMLKQNVLQHCIFHLLGLEMIRGSGSAGAGAQDFAAKTIRFPDEEDMEALCKMLSTAGKKFDQPKTKTVMNIIILRLVELSEDMKLPSRARFLIKDLLEMRDHMWEPRRAELQQKTLDEVRREAQKLQQQGKNAQHDNLSHRRKKTQITSAQLAKQSSSLLLHDEVGEEEEEEEEVEIANTEPVASSSPAKDATATEAVRSSVGNPQDDVAKFAARMKSIIQEYTSIMDIEEAAACVRELPPGACHVEFAEQTVNLSLEGKTEERENAVNLLVGLYERGALTAMVIETGLMSVAEFLEDIRIDIPLVHQYLALLLGRLISAGCFSLSWMIAHPLAHLVECHLASAVFTEVLSVLELDSDLRSVKRMLVDEEIAVASLLPAEVRGHGGRGNDTPEVQKFLLENGIEDFFAEGNDGVADGTDCDELDPEVAGKMRATLEEYLSVKDLGELVTCVEELEDEVGHDRWMHFVHLAAEHSIDSKKAVREDVAALLVLLWENEHVASDDVEVALESILAQYEDLRVDIPKIGANLSDLWTPLFHKQALPLSWLREATQHLTPSGFAAEVVVALLHDFEARFGATELREWWAKQDATRDGLWNELLNGSGAAVTSEDLGKWKQVLEL